MLDVLDGAARGLCIDRGSLPGVAGQYPILRIKTEHEEQRELVQWYRQSYRGSLIFAIPNGGKRGKAEAGRLKAEGVTPGVPDLFIPELQLFIEMKRTQGSSVSADQKAVMALLESAGYVCAVCKGKESAQAIIISEWNKRRGV